MLATSYIITSLSGKDKCQWGYNLSYKVYSFIACSPNKVKKHPNQSIIKQYWAWNFCCIPNHQRTEQYPVLMLSKISNINICVSFYYFFPNQHGVVCLLISLNMMALLEVIHVYAWRLIFVFTNFVMPTSHHRFRQSKYIDIICTSGFAGFPPLLPITYTSRLLLHCSPKKTKKKNLTRGSGYDEGYQTYVAKI